MKQPWHTEGYDKLASASMYILMSEKAGNVTYQDACAVVAVLVKAGKAIRKQYERNANRRAKHEALTSLGHQSLQGHDGVS
jgi:hypothetical protein